MFIKKIGPVAQAAPHFSPRSFGGEYGMRRPYMPFLAPEDGEGEGSPSGDGKPPASPPKQEDKTSDDHKKEADKLARELAKKARVVSDLEARTSDLAAQLERFKDIDPDAVRELMRNQEELKDREKKAEEERLRAAGDFEALRKRMAEETDKVVKEREAKLTESQKQIDVLNRQIREITIGAAFTASAFIRDETVLPTSKARRAYEDHFEIKDGQIIAYDRPATDSRREPLVNARGQALPFDEALKQIVENDPDKDYLLKSQRKSGSGEAPSGGKPGDRDNKNDSNLTGSQRIALALKARSGR